MGSHVLKVIVINCILSLTNSLTAQQAKKKSQKVNVVKESTFCDNSTIRNQPMGAIQVTLLWLPSPPHQLTRTCLQLNEQPPFLDVAISYRIKFQLYPYITFSLRSVNAVQWKLLDILSSSYIYIYYLYYSSIIY